MNGILWTARIAIPEGGARVDFNETDLDRILDDKRAAVPCRRQKVNGEATSCARS